MKINFPIGDFLIRLKNASIAGNKEVQFDQTKLIKSVALVLKKEGYLDKVEEKDGKILVTLSYRKKEPILMDIKLRSKPGLRVYVGFEDIEAKKGPTILIVSTPEGVMTGKDAIKKHLGGELIAEVL